MSEEREVWVIELERNGAWFPSSFARLINNQEEAEQEAEVLARFRLRNYRATRYIPEEAS